MAAVDVMMPTQPDFRYRHLSDVTSTLGGLWRKRLYTDLTLVADGKYVRCHRVVLASASPYFHSRLFNGKREAVTGKLFINDVSRDILSDVLDFVYTGECRLSQDNAEDLVWAAAIFKLKALRDMCDFYLKDTVHVKNALRLYSVARATGSQQLEERSRQVIHANLQQLLQSKLLGKLSCQELLNVLREDPLNDSLQEHAVDAAILAWVRAEKTRRSHMLGRIMRQLHLPQIRQEVLRQLMEENPAKEKAISIQMVHDAVLQMKLMPTAVEQNTPAISNPPQEVKLEDVLVMVGGMEVVGDGCRPCKEVHALHPGLGKWFSLASLPAYCDSGAAFCARGKEVFVAGVGENRQQLLKYDGERNSWTKLASLLKGRRGHCLVAVGPYLYVLGGVTVNGMSPFPSSASTTPVTTALVERYDILSDTWTEAGELAEAIWGASAVVFKDKIHIFGGFRGKSRTTCIVQSFDPESQLSRVSSQLPFPMAMSQAVVQDDKVFIMGPSGNILVSRDCWRFSLAISIPDFRRALFGMAVVKDHLYVAGGRCDDTVNDDVLVVDVQHGTMQKARERLPLSVWGCGFLLVTINTVKMAEIDPKDAAS